MKSLTWGAVNDLFSVMAFFLSRNIDYSTIHSYGGMLTTILHSFIFLYLMLHIFVTQSQILNHWMYAISMWIGAQTRFHTNDSITLYRLS